jgi:hypothetical protein
MIVSIALLPSIAGRFSWSLLVSSPPHHPHSCPFVPFTAVPCHPKVSLRERLKRDCVSPSLAAFLIVAALIKIQCLLADPDRRVAASEVRTLGRSPWQLFASRPEKKGGSTEALNPRVTFSRRCHLEL